MKLIKKLSLAGDNFIPEMLLRKIAFMYSSLGPFTKNKEKVVKLKKTEYARYIYQNKLDKS